MHISISFRTSKLPNPTYSVRNDALKYTALGPQALSDSFKGGTEYLIKGQAYLASR